MKKYLFLLLILFGCSGLQPINEDQRYINFTEEHSLNKDKAFDAAIEWIATNFRSANTVIQLKEKENGRIIVQAVGSYYFDILHTQIQDYYYTLSIRLNDKKIKYEFTINNIVGSSWLPTRDGLETINASFVKTKDSIQNALKNYNENNF